METIKLNTLPKKIFLGVFVLLILFAVDSSAKKVKFLPSAIAPAARGYVKIKKDKNHNNSIKIELFNLAEVSRLTPAKLNYIVWMETDDQLTKNIGMIESSTGFLSRKLKASFETSTPYNPFKIFISAEDDASSQYPGDQIVLTTKTFKY
jgi:hypothetical protein